MKVSETKCESYVNRLKKRAQIQLQKKRTQNAIIRRPIEMNQSQTNLKTVSSPLKQSKCFLTLLQVLTILIRKFKRVKNV